VLFVSSFFPNLWVPAGVKHGGNGQSKIHRKFKTFLPNIGKKRSDKALMKQSAKNSFIHRWEATELNNTVLFRAW